jgi:hypothetical protein
MRTPSILFLLLLAVMMTAGTCSDDDSSPTDGGSSDGDADGDSDSDADADALDSACSADTRAGGFTLVFKDNETSLDGSVSDFVRPSDIPELIDSSGTCSLLAPRNLFCDPPCDALGQTCGEEGTCINDETNQDVGTVTFTGLKTDLSVDPLALVLKYSTNISDPYPAFDPGDAISLQAEGGVYESFTLKGTGVNPVVTATDTITVAPNAPVVLSWEPGGIDNTQMYINLNVNVHAAATGWIECNVPDTGSFEIPANLVTTLINLGLSGFPKLILSRRSIDTATITPGCVEFIVYSEKDLEVEVPGLLSCSDDSDCDDGMTCSDQDLLCH